MMPVIRISDEVYGRLQKHATPFVDSPASVIERLLDAYETNQRQSRVGVTPPVSPSDRAPGGEGTPVAADGRPVPEDWLKILHYLFEQKAFSAETAVSKRMCMRHGNCGRYGYGELEETTPPLVQSCRIDGERGWWFYLTPEGTNLASKG